MSNYWGNSASVLNRGHQIKSSKKDDVELFNWLNVVMENTNDMFNVVSSSIGEEISYGISTPYPYGLPYSIGSIFFNIDMNYDVSIKENSKCVYNLERYFEVKIKNVTV